MLDNLCVGETIQGNLCKLLQLVTFQIVKQRCNVRGNWVLCRYDSVESADLKYIERNKQHIGT